MQLNYSINVIICQINFINLNRNDEVVLRKGLIIRPLGYKIERKLVF